MVDSQVLANAIRFLSIDAVEKSNSGHPGMPMGMADIAEVLWREHLKFNPKNANFYNRDRFILSNGHGSMLLYSLLHLTGYDLSIDDIKNFRQLHSKTAGHPEFGFADGIETTTGPLGQGLANAVGFALAEKILGETFNKDDFNIVDNYTYVFVGDGCLMEGVSHEASSFAGNFNLNKLIVFWDDNSISIDGNVQGWFKEDVAKRYESYGFNVIRNVDGHNREEINKAILQAKESKDKPTFICCKTTIGFGSPNKKGSEKSHGSPLGKDEVLLTRKNLNWNYDSFEIPQDIYDAWNSVEKGLENEQEWCELFAKYETKYPNLAREFLRRKNNLLPENWNNVLENSYKKILKENKKVATRKSSQMVLEEISPNMPELLGGSADLTGSNLTNYSGSKWINNGEKAANYISYGVREFGMSAIMNGMYLYGGFKPYGGTFLVFTDYARNAIRMSSLMKLPIIYVMTHDSIGLGEDGPTHQPVEHVSSLRLIPNLNVWRPCDTIETQVAWELSCESNETPSVLALSRQGLPLLVKDYSKVEDIKKGAYVLRENKKAQITLIATGSEVEIMVKAQKLLEENNIVSRIVSVPCLDIFLKQDDIYKNKVLGENPIIIMEAGSTLLWYSLLQNNKGTVLGIDRFGESAPANKVYEYLGLTENRILEETKKLV